jgi:hypothetical protein
VAPHDQWHIDWAIMGQQTLGMSGEAYSLVVLDVGSDLGAVINTRTREDLWQHLDELAALWGHTEDAPKGQRRVRDILNVMHDMPSTLSDIGINARTAEALRAAKLAAWKVMLQDWRDVGPHTTVWTAERDEHDEHARELATQQLDFNENPFSDKHLQIQWAMMAKSELQEETVDEAASKALHDLSWIDLTEPDPKHNGAAIRNERLAPIWKEEQGNEMTGLFARCCLKKVKRSDLPMGTRVISSSFHYKIKRHSAGEQKLKVNRLKVRLVVQGQHMSKDKGDFTTLSPRCHTFPEFVAASL